MKINLLLFLPLLLFISCEKPSDCIESAGETTTKDFDFTNFTQIDVDSGIEIVLTDGAEYKVQIQSGKNFIHTIAVTQSGETLLLKENSACNWVREYGRTIAFITAPNITQIYSKTDRNISSNGALTYPNLKVVALDKNGDNRDGAGTGDFFLQINNSNFEIQTNSLARFYVSGTTDFFTAGIYNGDSRIEAQNLIAKSIYTFHRGSNDVFLYPTQKIEGKLVSTGNVILKNNPPINTLVALYQGQIIYN